MRLKYILFLLLLLVIVGCSTEYGSKEYHEQQKQFEESGFIANGVDKVSDKVTDDMEIEHEIQTEEFKKDKKSVLNVEIMTTESGIKYIVDPNKIMSGGPPRDGIPSIDDPNYVSVEEADEWIKDNELVLAIVYKDVKRVYPLQILVWHEIVNDVIAGDPILVTYCPLCGSGIAYDRTLDGEAVEFGTSGKLYNSNLVMYDRKTITYWTQIDGQAIIGERSGEMLIPISIDTVPWRDWKKEHDDSEVLSQNTGYLRNYGRDPYGNYYEDSFVIFPLENEDDRIHPKTVIFGVEIGGTFVAFEEDDIIEDDIEDLISGVNVKVERDDAGIVKITNVDTGEEIVKERDFWFAWYAFHPETILYGFNE